MTDPDFIAWLRSGSSIRVALVEVIARIGSTETTLYLSNRSFTTGATDTPANTPYDACIVGGVSFSEALNLDGEPSISYGDLEIGNRAGVRDGWLDYVWANRQVQIYMGDPRWPRADFRLVFDGVVGDLGSRDPEVLNLHLLDKLQRLNNPISEATLGGTTSNKDRNIPECFGEPFNVTPLQTNPATLEYQVHGGGPIEDIPEVRTNGGVPVSINKFLSTGKFTLVTAPGSTTITCSVQGDKPGGTYSKDASALVQRIVTGYGPTATRLSSGDLDATSLAAFAAAHTQAMGLYCEERTNVLQACQQLAGSIGAHVVNTTLGLLRLVQLALPAAGTPVVITDEDIDYHGLSITDRPPVKAACLLGYAKNWTVQEALAGGMAAASVPIFQQEWWTKTSSDATVASVYKLDVNPVQEDTLLVVEAEAAAEAQRRRDLWKVPRTVFSARCKAHLLLTELGDAITITHDRFGLSGGATGMVVSIARDWLAGRITLGVLV